MAEIISIHIVRGENAPTESCNQVVVRTNFGIEGDHRSGKYQIGQITLVEAEIMDAQYPTNSAMIYLQVQAGGRLW